MGNDLSVANCFVFRYNIVIIDWKDEIYDHYF